MVDPQANSVLLYDREGKFLRNLGDPRESATTPFLPTNLTPVGDGFLLTMADQKRSLMALRLGPEGVRLPGAKAFEVRRGPNGELNNLNSVYQLDVSHGALIGYGSLYHVRIDTTKSTVPERPFRLGFFAGLIDDSVSGVELVKEFEDNDYYIFGYPYVAATDKRGFYLAMSGTAELWEFDLPSPKTLISGLTLSPSEAGPRLLKEALPPGYRHAPGFKTKPMGFSTAAALFQELQQQKIPAAIYGLSDSLYLLTREPNLQGPGTLWKIFKIDRSSEKFENPVLLPTHAAHLTVIPGKNSWRIIERGEVVRWGKEEIASFLEIPASWITAPKTSPLLESAGGVVCQ